MSLRFARWAFVMALALLGGSVALFVRDPSWSPAVAAVASSWLLPMLAVRGPSAAGRRRGDPELTTAIHAAATRTWAKPDAEGGAR